MQLEIAYMILGERLEIKSDHIGTGLNNWSLRTYSKASQLDILR